MFGLAASRLTLALQQEGQAVEYRGIAQGTATNKGWTQLSGDVSVEGSPSGVTLCVDDTSGRIVTAE